jgi:excisionase family DNA binding protein
MAATMSDPGETDPRVSSDEAARILGISPGTVRKWARQGKLDAVAGEYNGRPTLRIRLPSDADLGIEAAPATPLATGPRQSRRRQQPERRAARSWIRPSALRPSRPTRR